VATALETRIREGMIMSNSSKVEWKIRTKFVEVTLTGYNVFIIYEKDWVILYDNNGERSRYPMSLIEFITRTVLEESEPLPVKPEAPCSENEEFIPGVLTRLLEKFRLKKLYIWLIGNNYE